MKSLSNIVLCSSILISCHSLKSVLNPNSQLPTTVHPTTLHCFVHQTCSCFFNYFKYLLTAYLHRLWECWEPAKKPPTSQSHHSYEELKLYLQLGTSVGMKPPGLGCRLGLGGNWAYPMRESVTGELKLASFPFSVCLRVYFLFP